MLERTTLIRRAAFVSLVGNAALAAAKLLAGFLAGSLAVVGDGIDSSTDVVISMVALVAAGVIAKPSDREHPYGHARAETSATTILSFVIFFAGAQLFLSAASRLAPGELPPLPDPLALWVTGLSIAGKLGLAWSQFAMGKKASSSMLVANGKNMANDVIMSSAVLVGLGLSLALKLPILDPALAVAVGLWVMRSAVGIFREANDELMDGRADERLYRAVFEAVRSVDGAGNPHRVRVRKLASVYDVDLDIEVDGGMSVRRAHGIAQKVEEAIKERIDGVYDIVVHVEPAGEGQHDEQYGLTEGCLGEGPP